MKDENLASQAEPFNYGIVAVNAFLFQIVEQLTALPDQFEKAATGMMVLLMALEVLRQIRDSLAEQRDLHLGRTRVGWVQFKGVDYGFLPVRGHYHGVSSSLLTVLPFRSLRVD